MSVIKLDDLLSGTNLRKTQINVPGLGDVEITELASVEATELAAAAKSVDSEDEEANAAFIVQWVYRLLSGKKGSKVDVSKLRQNLSSDVLLEIYKQGLTFNLVADDSKEEIEKNS